jgi:hypothetical protein
MEKESENIVSSKYQLKKSNVESGSNPLQVLKLVTVQLLQMMSIFQKKYLRKDVSTSFSF